MRESAIDKTAGACLKKKKFFCFLFNAKQLLELSARRFRTPSACVESDGEDLAGDVHCRAGTCRNAFSLEFREDFLA
jgi:hypothetical protein